MHARTSGKSLPAVFLANGAYKCLSEGALAIPGALGRKPFGQARAFLRKDSNLYPTRAGAGRRHGHADNAIAC